LFSCVEFVKDKNTKEPIVPYGMDPYGKLAKIIGSLKEKGFMTFGHENMVLCNPPLIITEEQLTEELDKLEEVIKEVDSDPFYMQ
jgi:taurine--2-oxoglutarate transaminase